MSTATKLCRGCDTELPFAAFDRRGGTEQGLRSRCKRCRYAAKGHRPMTRMSDEERQRHRDDTMLRHRYNISLDEYERILASQNGVCADCGLPPGDTRLHVDHDHECCPGRSCGKCIRDIVCFQCNLERG